MTGGSSVPADRALADALAAAVTAVPGVVRLVPRLHERVGAALHLGADGRAVDLSRVRGDVRVEVRVVVSLSRPPAVVVRDIAAAVAAGIVESLPDAPEPEIVVTVVDVAP